MRALCLRAVLLFAIVGPLAKAQLFQNPPLIPTAIDPQTVAAADFNRDGKLDLTYIDSVAGYATGAHLHILLGNGDGSFVEGKTITLPKSSGGFINIADVNHDGNLDILIGAVGSSQSGSLAVYLGNGDGTFQAPLISTFSLTQFTGGISSTGCPMAIADLNGDDNLDLVIPDPVNEQIYVLFGDGHGRFNLANSYLNFNNPNQAILVDLTGSGKLDLVVNTNFGGVYVYKGKGNGVFQGSLNGYQLQNAAQHILLIDINGDHHPDIVAVTYTYNSMANTLSYQFSMLPGKADGTFGTLTTILPLVPYGSVPLAYTDVNGDGHPDIVLLTDTGVAIYYGKAGGGFSGPTVLLAGPSGLAGAALGRFTSAANHQLALGTTGGILMLDNLAPGAPSGPTLYDLGETIGAVTLADFNGDGNPDIAAGVAAYYPRVLMGSGDGSFKLLADQNASYPSGLNPASTLEAGNFAHSSHVSILDGPFLVPDSGNIYNYDILAGTGDGTFDAPVELSAIPTFTATTDLNHDGLPDFLLLSGLDTTAPAVLTAYLATSGGGFNVVTTTLRNSNCGFVAMGDLNGDRFPDLVLSCSIIGDTFLEVWLGDGRGGFHYLNTIAWPSNTHLQPYPVSQIADVDGDGHADLVIPSGGVSIYYGDGTGALASPVNYPTSRVYPYVAVADVNADGKPDLVLNDASSIAVLLNRGHRSYAAEQDLVAGSNMGPLQVADLNHDGYPDLVARSGNSTLAILLNLAGKGSALPAATGGFANLPTAAVAGQPLKLNLALSASTAAGAAPTGEADFYLDNALLATLPLASGSAGLTLPGSATASLYSDSHSLVAFYRGDLHYSAGRYLGAFTVVEPSLPTTTVLAVNSASLLTSQILHLTATVQCTTKLPAGRVVFREGSRNLGSTLLNRSGVAFFNTNLLAAGSHAITAAYLGLAPNNLFSVPGFLASTSPAVNVTVSSYPTSTALSVSSVQVPANTVETLTATVTSANGTPFGSLAFYDSSTLLGAVTLVNGKATWSTSSLAAGAHALTAVYRANAVFGTSSSKAVQVVVNADSGRNPISSDPASTR